MRGEDDNGYDALIYSEETPPRAWGRQGHAVNRLPLGGNTPTCVGKTPARSGDFGPIEKHPHVRGEDTRMTGFRRSSQETPPRAWGRPKFYSDVIDPLGNTPTCVGKTRLRCDRWQWLRKHPHVRGEDRKQYGQQRCAWETPPRAWGRPTNVHHGGMVLGNTPTCVGKTALSGVTALRFWKHPHVRGEDSASTSSSTLSTETPPRAWGRLAWRARYCVNRRNTPTCVGKTPTYCERARV